MSCAFLSAATRDDVAGQALGGREFWASGYGWSFVLDCEALKSSPTMTTTVVLGQVGAVEDDAAAEYSTDVAGHREGVRARAGSASAGTSKLSALSGAGRFTSRLARRSHDRLAHADLAAAVAHLHGHGGVIGGRPPGDAGLIAAGVRHEGELPFGDAASLAGNALHDGAAAR